MHRYKVACDATERQWTEAAESQSSAVDSSTTTVAAGACIKHTMIEHIKCTQAAVLRQ